MRVAMVTTKVTAAPMPSAVSSFLDTLQEGEMLRELRKYYVIDEYRTDK